MTRREAIEVIAAAARDAAVICNLGHPSQELYWSGDRDNQFYMLGSMGLAGPIGLGLALTGRRVVVLDGDGSLLMNPNTLVTAAQAGPVNLKWFVLDNGVYGSTGNQPTASRRGQTSLAGLARAAGIESVEVWSDPGVLRRGLAEVVGSTGLRLVVVEVEVEAAPTRPIPLDPIAIRNRLRKWLASHPETGAPGAEDTRDVPPGDEIKVKDHD
jgi:thiamine pyrophosphate-dependent acetolactate synthase large subunit-like protein